jgi:hypothetical protein
VDAEICIQEQQTHIGILTHIPTQILKIHKIVKVNGLRAKRLLEKERKKERKRKKGRSTYYRRTLINN